MHLCLIKIRPSYLNGVVASIESYLSESVANGRVFDYHVYLALGDYDVVVISRSTNAFRSFVGNIWLDGIAGIREIPIHLWFADQSESFDQLIHKQSVSLTFVQLHPATYHDLGLCFEREFARCINDLPDRPVTFAVGGIPEFLVAQSWSHPSDIPGIIDNVVRCGQTVARRFGLTYTPLLRTVTFVALSYHEIEPLPVVSQDDDKISLRVSVSAMPGHIAYVANILKECLETPEIISWTTGTTDIAVSVPITSTSDLARRLRQVLLFRERARNAAVQETSSALMFGAGKRHQDTLERRVLRTPLTISTNDELDLLRTVFGRLGERIIRTCYNFNDIAANPVIGAGLVDLHLPISRLLEDAVSLASSVDRKVETLSKALGHLNERLIPIHAAVDQRTIAGHAAVSPVESHARSVVGGISRLLLAIEGIAHSILSYTRQRRWYGYAVTSVRHPDFYHEGLVIDIPSYALLTPEQWFPAIHEAFHSYVDQEFGGLGDLHGALSAALAQCPSAIGEIALDADTLIEIFIDILTFSTGPFWHPRLMYKSIWNYLRDGERSRATLVDRDQEFARWFIRNSCVWLALLPDAQVKSFDPSTNAGAEKSLNVMVDRYNEWGLDDVVDEATQVGLTSEASLGDVSRLWPIIELAGRHIPHDADDIEERQLFYEDRAGLILESAANGNWDFREAIPYPELLVWKLKHLYCDGSSTANSTMRNGLVVLLIDTFWRIRRETYGPAYLAD